MPRAAGDERNYDIAIVDKAGKSVGVLAGFPSVTTVIGDTDGTGKDAFAGWGFNLGVTGMLDLLNRGHVKAGDSEPNIKKRLKARRAAPWQRRDDRAEEGTAVHDQAEKLLRHQVDYDDVLEALGKEQQGYGKALIKWHTKYEEQRRMTVAIERTLVSLEHQYAGTCDLIDQETDWLPHHCRIVDYKTSSQVRDSHLIQGTAYALAWQEMTANLGEPMIVREISVVRFGDDGEYEEHIVPFDGTAPVFLKMLALYKERATRRY